VRRWRIILGRGGTILLAIGLALLLVSLIPAAQIGNFSGTWIVQPERFDTPYTPFSERVVTPQQGLHITATANSTLNVYLLEVKSQTIYRWINEHHLEPIDSSNVTYLEEFLTSNPESIGWQNEIPNENIEFEYVPTKITNTTLVFSNPSSHFIHVEYEGSITALVAPRSKVQTLAQWTIPIGFVLALPWLIDLWRVRTRRRGSQLQTKPT